MASSRCILCLLIFGLVVACVLVITGIIGITVGPDILQNQISNQLPLTAYSDQLHSWEVPPVPIYLQFWLWECVNKAEVLQGIEKPMIVQRGPFTYLEHRQKTEVAFNENYTVTYRQAISYKFIREKSFADEQHVVTMINTPVVTFVSLLRNQSKLVQEAFNLVTIVLNDTLFATHTAGEWLWGYEDPILKAAKKIPILEPLIPDDHFGYFYEQNATDDGLYTVFTGGSNIALLNNINRWNGVSHVPYWKTPYGNQINGTDGSWFPPLYNKDLETERLYLFSTDVCRSVYATFQEHSSVLSIPTALFTIPSEVFANYTVNPDNAAFGSNDSGILDVSVCRQGAPIYISLPHLLYAADQYTDRVEGIAPDSHIHQTIFEVEPHTGLVLRAQKRLQINVFVEPDQFIDDFKHVSAVLLPAIWINESTTIDQKSADDLNNQVLRYFVTVRWVSIGFITFGIIMFIITIIFFAKRHSRYGASARLLFAESHNSIAQHDDY